MSNFFSGVFSYKNYTFSTYFYILYIMPLLWRKTTAKKSHTKWSVGLFSVEGLFPLYLAVISLVSIIVLCVNIGILTSSIGNYILITDKEYVLSDRAWEVRQCSEPEWKGDESIEKKPMRDSTMWRKSKKDGYCSTIYWTQRNIYWCSFLVSGLWFIILLSLS